MPDLSRGTAPEADFALLAEELDYFIDQVLHGDFFDRFQVPEHLRVIKDIAISGNGEPTSLPDFAKAVQLIGELAQGKGLFPEIGFVLITNGSLMHQAKVQEGLKQLNRFAGEVWFKLDSATEQGRRKINNSVESDRMVLEHLKISASLCRTKLQTCLLNFKQFPWTEEERNAYLALLKRIKGEIALQEILLYGIARQSLQPEADELAKVNEEQMNQFAERIRALGYKVRISF
nr:radical SAM protein [Methylomarinum sp. Ch1-1]MDP4521594.1 radical SAM protein [Methylomarinum sp. Ch1-1]